MKDDSNRVVTLGASWLAMLRSRARWLVSQCKRASGGSDSVDVDRAGIARLLENHPTQSVALNIDLR
jgi:hypothetical protein